MGRSSNNIIIIIIVLLVALGIFQRVCSREKYVGSRRETFTNNIPASKCCSPVVCGWNFSFSKIKEERGGDTLIPLVLQIIVLRRVEEKLVRNHSRKDLFVVLLKMSSRN